MKTKIIIFSLLLLNTVGAGQDDRPISVLLDAIEQVESGGDCNAVGDNGNAVGCMQIWKIYVDDCNRILGKNAYTYSDRLSRSKSREMVKVYVVHYASELRLKRTPTQEDMARCHNGGPNGYKKECTKKYWLKVRKELENDNKR